MKAIATHVKVTRLSEEHPRPIYTDKYSATKVAPHPNMQAGRK